MGFSLPMNEWWLQPWGASGWGRDSRKTRARLEGWNFQPHALTSREGRGLETGLIIKADEFIHHAYVKKKKTLNDEVGRAFALVGGVPRGSMEGSSLLSLPHLALFISSIRAVSDLYPLK